ncbi:hypothetical protein [Burkholderia pseudomallei]|uniref:hypothetical protein n=1 Tax=Burkholderia pseudomallei TaxID=28450 RepID=UPI001F5FFB75|nr:hypothetical protein [Burkholderia pseudomallei]
MAPLRAVRPLEARHAGERAADVRAERDRAVEPLHERGEAKPGLRVAGRAEHGRRVAQRGETDRAATGRVRGGEPPGLEWRGDAGWVMTALQARKSDSSDGTPAGARLG